MLHVTWLVFPTFLDGLKKMNLLIPVFHIALYLLKYLSNVRLLIKIYARRRAIERRWRSLRHPRSPATSSTPRPADIKNTAAGETVRTREIVEREAQDAVARALHEQ